MASPNLRDTRGFTLVEALVTIALIAVIAGIATPIVFGQRTAGIEAAQRADLLVVSAEVEQLITGWRGAPDAQAALTTTDGVWSLAQDGSAPEASGNLSDGITLTGTVWTDGSYCLAAAHADVDTQILRSDDQKVVKGTCPNAALGGVGTLPNATTITLPAAVTGLTATSTADNQVTAAWNAVPGATGYVVKVEGLAAVITTDTSLTVTAVPAGTATVTVFARSTTGAGAASTATVAVAGAAGTDLSGTVDDLLARLADAEARLDALETTPEPSPAP